MQNTIVTACNSRYLWGAILMIASIRYQGDKTPIQVWGKQLSGKDVALLHQFDYVEVVPFSKQEAHLIKPTALLNVESEYATWIDSDCMFKGAISPLILPRNEGIHIRFRSPDENALVFDNKYAGNAFGLIPEGVLSQWKQDVSDRSQPRHMSQCVSNFISIHRRHFDFVELWEKHISNLPEPSPNPVDKRNQAYFMTDESVLSSLLLFSSIAPNISPYVLDKEKNRRLIHFGQHLKPWETWRTRHLKHYTYVLGIIHYLRKQGYRLPDLPYSLNERYKTLTYLTAITRTGFSDLKSQCRQLMSGLLHKSPFARH